MSQPPPTPPTSTSATTEPTPGVRYRVRRAPKFGPFLATGALIGLVLGVVIDIVGPDATNVQPGSSLAFFAALGAGLGAFIAALVVLILDRRS